MLTFSFIMLLFLGRTRRERSGEKGKCRSKAPSPVMTSVQTVRVTLLELCNTLGTARSVTACRT